MLAGLTWDAGEPPEEGTVMLLAWNGTVEAVSGSGSATRFAVGTNIFDYFDDASGGVLQACMAHTAEHGRSKTCWPVCTSTSTEALIFEAQVVCLGGPSESSRKFALCWSHTGSGSTGLSAHEASDGKAIGRAEVQALVHDLNNLLTTILSFAGFLVEDLEQGDSRREDAKEVLKATRQATLLAARFLDSEHES